MYLFSYTKISAALKPISTYLKFSAFKCHEWGKGRAPAAQWPRQCQRHLHKWVECHERASDVHLYRHCERARARRGRTRQSSGGQRYGVPTAQVYGSPRVYVPDGTDARDDGEKCAQVCGSVAARIGLRGKALSGQVRASRTCWQNALIG